ncbi:hypothetical protein ACJ41O_014999 [Fusarium nematophilum]
MSGTVFPSYKLQPKQCEVCHKKEGLLRCSGCQAVYYCGQEHQTSHRPQHKKPCTATKKARARYEKEEQDLRNHPPDMFFPGNVFETSVGHFWGIMETRDYMRARYGLVDNLLQHFGQAGGRAEVVQAALGHMLDMMRLCRSDNMGLRYQIPALYIRLGRDQEAYDFMKWYATTGQQNDYDWGDTDLPFLDVRDADIFEAPLSGWTNGEYVDVSHVACIALIKTRVMLDLQACQDATKAFRGTIPQEIIDTIRGQLVGSIVASRPDILLRGSDEIDRLVESLAAQFVELFGSVDACNNYFWDLLIDDDPSEAIANRPNMYSPGSVEEACLTLGYLYPAFAETPKALAAIENISDQIPLGLDGDDDGWETE